MNWLNLIVISLLALSLACGDADEDPGVAETTTSAPQGLDDSAEISDTTDDERQALCDDVGDFSAQSCPGGLERQASTAAQCKTRLDQIAALPNCELTAGDYRDVAGDDFCSDGLASFQRLLACAAGGS